MVSTKYIIQAMCLQKPLFYLAIANFVLGIYIVDVNADTKTVPIFSLLLLGDPPVEGSPAPVDVATFSWHSCIRFDDETLKCWGYNGEGQLGNGSSGSTAGSKVPVSVTGINNAQAVDTGYDHTCALLEDSTIKCWGWNEYGQHGNGSTANSSVPANIVTGINNAASVSTGSFHTCALLEDSTVKCWGGNSSWNNTNTNYGELGNGSAANSSVPVSVTGINNAASVSAGVDYACALLEDSTVKCWGRNLFGKLGNDSFTDSSVPVSVNGIDNAASVVAGIDHACAVLEDSTIKCWGKNTNGQLGNGSTTLSKVPVSVTGINNAASVSVGQYHTCAVLEDSTVKCWGSNYSGQLGNNTTTDSSVPVSVNGIDNAASVATGSYHTCAVLEDSTVKCWGSNNSGQLGNNTTTDSSVPVEVSL